MNPKVGAVKLELSTEEYRVNHGLGNCGPGAGWISISIPRICLPILLELPSGAPVFADFLILCI